MTRAEIINSLISKYNYKSYLEIGVGQLNNFLSIKVDLKHGIDPNVGTTFRMTSDEFFERNLPQKYDLIFVDGLHIFEQAHKDIINSLDILNDNGTIVVHDCNPLSEIVQRKERETDMWNGDVWKSILKLRVENPNISISTVDADHGCAVIQKGYQNLLTFDSVQYDYDFLDAHRKEILNLISVEEFKEKYL